MHNISKTSTADLFIEWSEAPWDTAVFGAPVLQITKMNVLGPLAGNDFQAFESARDRLESVLVSCRLSHECLKESMLLEDRSFRFIEMLYHPELNDLQNRNIVKETELAIAKAGVEDLPVLMDIAGSVFYNERFHVDPRLDNALGNQRYRNWVNNSIAHPTQDLYVIRDGNQVVSFFIIEMLPDQTCYWHLNAVAEYAQGHGYGKRAWEAMLYMAQQKGANRVRTCIVVRNNRVLNLYSRLGFNFSPPLMTFHWVKTD